MLHAEFIQIKLIKNLIRTSPIVCCLLSPDINNTEVVVKCGGEVEEEEEEQGVEALPNCGFTKLFYILFGLF